MIAKKLYRLLISSFSALCFFAVGVRHAPAAEWWQGAFVDESAACDVNDSLIRFEKKYIKPWEEECRITRFTNIDRMPAIILDQECSFPDSPGESTKGRRILMKIDKAKMISYLQSNGETKFDILKRCPGLERQFQ